MIMFQQALLVLNMLLIFVFGIDCFVIDNPKVTPKVKAKTGVLLASVFLAFLVLLMLFVVLSVMLKRNALYLALAIYILIPFVIGRLASYRTLRFYAVLQMFSFLLSAITLYII